LIQKISDYLAREKVLNKQITDLHDQLHNSLQGEYRKKKEKTHFYLKKLLSIQADMKRRITKAVRRDVSSFSYLQYILGLFVERESLTLKIIDSMRGQKSSSCASAVTIYKMLDEMRNLIFKTEEKLLNTKELMSAFEGTNPFSNKGIQLRKKYYNDFTGKIPIIVPVYCSNQELLEITERMVITSISRNYSKTLKVVMVDDCSPLENEVKKLVEESKTRYALDITLIRNEENIGYARSIQKGVDNTDSPFFIMANNDIYIPHGSIDSILSIINNDPTIGGIGPISSSGTNSSQFSTLGPKKLEKYSKEKCRLLEETALAVRENWGGLYYEVRFLCGWFVLFNREAFLRTGGFNPLLIHSYNEDSDISWGLQKCGYKLIVDRGSYIFHGYEKEHGFIGPSMSSVSLKSLKNWIRNAYHFSRKYGFLQLNTVYYNFNWRKTFPQYFPPESNFGNFF